MVKLLLYNLKILRTSDVLKVKLFCRLYKKKRFSHPVFFFFHRKGEETEQLFAVIRISLTIGAVAFTFCAWFVSVFPIYLSLFEWIEFCWFLVCLENHSIWN